MKAIASLMKGKGWLPIAVSGTLVLMAVCVLCYVYWMASPLVRGDEWYYTDTFLKSYLDGHLSVIDFFSKRGPGENAQPINRLVLLALVRWFQMDFTVQGLLGACLAIACVGLLTFLAWREPRPAGQPDWARTLLPLGLGAVILSLNARADYGWPLVTALVYTGTLGISLYYYLAADLSEKGAWFRLGLLTFATLVLLDTFATLAVLGAVLLMLTRIPGSPRRWHTAATALVTFAGFVIYQRLFTWFTGTPNSPLGIDQLQAAVSNVWHHLDIAWQVLVVPFGGALFEPPPHYPHPWLVLGVLAVLLWPLHVWFWWRFASERQNRVAFLAGGLMLYCYATIAGMVVDRLPRYGIDYVLQPRYVAFYQLQLLALLLMWSRSGMPQFGARHYRTWAGAACALLLCLNARAAISAWEYQPDISRYDQQVVSQIQALADDPAHPPEDCLPDITPCRWPEKKRREVLQILQDHQLNVFSPEFRARHGYDWQEAPAQH